MVQNPHLALFPGVVDGKMIPHAYGGLTCNMGASTGLRETGRDDEHHGIGLQGTPEHSTRRGQKPVAIFSSVGPGFESQRAHQHTASCEPAPMARKRLSRAIAADLPEPRSLVGARSKT